jgi:hypothetical protein
MENAKFANDLLLTCPETGEELRPYCEPFTNDEGALVLLVQNKDGSKKWKHKIWTEEVGVVKPLTKQQKLEVSDWLVGAFNMAYETPSALDVFNTLDDFNKHGWPSAPQNEKLSEDQIVELSYYLAKHFMVWAIPSDVDDMCKLITKFNKSCKEQV